MFSAGGTKQGLSVRPEFSPANTTLPWLGELVSDEKDRLLGSSVVLLQRSGGSRPIPAPDPPRISAHAVICPRFWKRLLEVCRVAPGGVFQHTEKAQKEHLEGEPERGAPPCPHPAAVAGTMRQTGTCCWTQ